MVETEDREYRRTKLAVTIAGVDQETAEVLVQGSCHLLVLECDSGKYLCDDYRLGPVSATQPMTHGIRAASRRIRPEKRIMMRSYHE
jgi:hypothetical protein